MKDRLSLSAPVEWPSVALYDFSANRRARAQAYQRKSVKFSPPASRGPTTGASATTILSEVSGFPIARTVYT